MQALTNTPQDQQENVLEHAKFLFPNDRYLEYPEINTLFKIILSAPQDQREDVIKTAKFLVSESPASNKEYWNTRFNDILKTIIDIPVDQRKDVIEQAIPLIQNTYVNGVVQDILKEIYAFHQEQRRTITTKINSLISTQPPILSKNDKLNPANILRAISRIDVNQREDVIEKTILIYDTIPLSPNSSNPEYIFEALSPIPANQRTDVIEKLKCLIQNNNHLRGNDLVPIMKLLANIPQNQRGELVIKARPFIGSKPFTEDSLSGGQICEVLRSLS